MGINPFAKTYVPKNRNRRSHKWNPGNYIFAASAIMENPTDLNNLLTVEIPEIKAAAGRNEVITGVIFDVLWRDLETSQGVYNFTTIQSYANSIKSAGLKWGMRIYFRTYNDVVTDPDSHAIPNYMISDTATYGGGYGTGDSAGGEYEGENHDYNAKMWVTAVKNRFQALLEAIGNQFNSDSEFAFALVQETSMLNGFGTGGSPDNPKNDATIVDNYFTNLISAVTAARAASWNATPLIQVCNFPASLLSMSPTFMAQMKNGKVGLGIQDFYLRLPSGCNSLVNSYEEIDLHVGIVPIAANMSNRGSLLKKCDNTIPGDSYYDLAVDAVSRGVNIITWHVQDITAPSDGYDRYVLIKALLSDDAPETRPVTTYPSSY